MQKQSKKMIKIKNFVDKLTQECRSASDVASELELNYNTTRTYLSILAESGDVVKTRKGNTVSFSSKFSGIEDIVYRSFENTSTMFPLVHGLAFHITDLFNQKYQQEGLGLYCRCGLQRTDFEPCSNCSTRIRTGTFKHNRVWQYRNITWQYGRHKTSCYVQVGCSDNPLDFTSFCRLIDKLEELTWIDFWKLQEDWIIKQYGIGKDFQSIHRNKLPESANLNLFGKIFAEFYDKTLPGGESVTRAGVHIKDSIIFQDFVALLQGSLTKEQQLQGQALLHKDIRDLISSTQAKDDIIINFYREVKNTLQTFSEEIKNIRDELGTLKGKTEGKKK